LRKEDDVPKQTLLLFAWALLLPALAHAQRGVQLTPDQRQILVNKDVGEERWAISLNLDDNTVTGNVYFPSGSDPEFLWCQYLSDNGAADQTRLEIVFSCFGADACVRSSDPLEGWSFIANVTVPGTFFIPPGTSTASSLAWQPLEALRSGARALRAGSSLRPPESSPVRKTDDLTEIVSHLEAQGVRAAGRGSQLTPDQKRFLVSKNVGDERWAITFNNEVSTVTGNVFFTSGFGDPAFLWCDRLSDDGDPDPVSRQIRFSCFAADPCPAIPCGSERWGFLTEVVIAGGFFQPTSCDGEPPPPVALSGAQRAFAAARGLPEQFAIMFATQTVDASGGRISLATPRRIESWMYNRGQLVVALFDNGFFVREEVTGPAAPLARTSLNPAQFQPGMTRTDVEAILGPPSCEESVTMGGVQLTALRYRATASEPVRSVTLAEGEISSVVAGFAIRNDGSTSTDPCS
jgi:hypothetical protein